METPMLKKHAVRAAAAATCIAAFGMGVASADAALNPIKAIKTGVSTTTVVTVSAPVLVPALADSASGFQPPIKTDPPTTTPPATVPPAPPAPPISTPPPPPPPPAF